MSYDFRYNLRTLLSTNWFLLAPTPLPSPKSELPSQHKSSHSHQLGLPVHHLCDLDSEAGSQKSASLDPSWALYASPTAAPAGSSISAEFLSLTITISIWSWSNKWGNRRVHNCSSRMHTPNPNQKPNGWIQGSPPAAAYKVDTTWGFSLVPPTSPPQLAIKVSANGLEAWSCHVPNTKQSVRCWLNWSPITPGNLGPNLNFSDPNYTLYTLPFPTHKQGNWTEYPELQLKSQHLGQSLGLANKNTRGCVTLWPCHLH